ncbi:Hydroxyethylthiazole kinase [Hordeum vulgare]|nr:Hydroxyethylthiazole kinase [Hordeum vulgare]
MIALSPSYLKMSNVHTNPMPAYSILIVHLASNDTDTSGQLQGVNISHDSGETLQAVKALAWSSGAVIAVSGAVDFIADGEQVVSASNGVAMMHKITAT